MANLSQIQKEKQEDQQKKQNFREGLDLAIKIKFQENNQNMINKYETLKTTSQEVEEARQAEIKDSNIRRRFEASFLETSMLESLQQKRKTREQELKEQEEMQNIYKEYQKLDEKEKIQAINGKRLQSALNKKIVENLKQKYQEKKEEEKNANKEFIQSEWKIIDHMIKKNEEFIEGIRQRTEKNQECKRMTVKMQNDFFLKKKQDDYFLVEKPVDDRLQSELIREKDQLEEMKQKKCELSHFILRQIQQSNLDKNVSLYKNMEEEHAIITKEMERLDEVEKIKKNKIRTQLQETMNTLKTQISLRQEALKEKNTMNSTEVWQNNPKADFPNQQSYIPEKTLQYIPGYAYQHDKHLMNKHADQVGERNKIYMMNIQTGIDRLKENNEDFNKPKSSIFEGRRKTQDYRINKMTEPLKEYDFIRNRQKNGVFNIITNTVI